MESRWRSVQLNPLGQSGKGRVPVPSHFPEMVRRTHAASRRRCREKFLFWRGVLAAQGPLQMKLADDMEDLTPPLNFAGASY